MKAADLNEYKKVLVGGMSTVLDNMVMNPNLSVDKICSDKNVFYDLLQNRKFIPFISLGTIGSMSRFIDDIPLNLDE